MEGNWLDNKYIVIGMNNSISEPMTRKEAINKVKDNYKDGVTSYIVSQAEGERIKEEGEFNTPKWS